MIFDKKDTKNKFRGRNSSNLPVKSKLINGSNKNRESIEKNAAVKLHKTITKSLDL